MKKKTKIQMIFIIKYINYIELMSIKKHNK